MRTTIRLDDDLMRTLKRRAASEDVSLTRLINRLLRLGLRSAQATNGSARKYREKTFAMGEPKVDLTKALAVAAALEDAVVLEKLAQGK